VDPFSAQSDSPVTRAIQEIAVEQGANVSEYGGVACRMKTVAAVIESLPARFETSGVSSHDGSLLDHSNARPSSTAQLIRRSDASGPGTENQYVRLTHAAGRTQAP
jgi:hypothetical protein